MKDETSWQASCTMILYLGRMHNS